jgi:hypothetical protein
MKHTLRCHDFGWGTPQMPGHRISCRAGRSIPSQNRASPQGVAARIAASFVASLANTASIGCTSLRAIDDFGSHRTRVSLC